MFPRLYKFIFYVEFYVANLRIFGKAISLHCISLAHHDLKFTFEH